MLHGSGAVGRFLGLCDINATRAPRHANYTGFFQKVPTRLRLHHYVICV
jgi:hypothetical protein